MKIHNLFLISASVILASCATTYKDFKLSDVNYKEGVAIGKVNIKYNGVKRNTDCAVCLYHINGKGNGGPCQKLTDEGLVFLDVLKGDTSLGRIECKDTSIYHYNPIGAFFTQADDVTYFGEVNIEWQNSGGFKASDMFGLVGAAFSEAQVYGQLKMSTQVGNMSEVVKAYEAQTKQEKVKVVKSIMSASK
jgi:hypothetical protein